MKIRPAREASTHDSVKQHVPKMSAKNSHGFNGFDFIEAILCQMLFQVVCGT